MEYLDDECRFAIGNWTKMESKVNTMCMCVMCVCVSDVVCITGH